MRKHLLLYLASAEDPQRVATGPVLAALAHRNQVLFECYYDAPRRGLHFGSGDPADAPPGVAGGSLVVGGRHLEQVTALAVGHHVLALGDPGSAVWPALFGTAAEVLAQSSEPCWLTPTPWLPHSGVSPQRAPRNSSHGSPTNMRGS